MEPKETSTNTYVFDADSPTELARLINQERVMSFASEFFLIQISQGIGNNPEQNRQRSKYGLQHDEKICAR